MLAIMGPSVREKTTLMNIIGCLDNRQRELSFWMAWILRRVRRMKYSDLRLNKIGFVFRAFIFS